VRLRSAAASLVALVLAVGSVLAWRTAPDDEKARAQPAVAGAASADGGTLFAAKGCASCHRSAGTEPLVDGLPDLTTVAEWGGTRRPGMDAAAYVAESVRSPSAFLAPGWSSNGPTTGMPSLVVTDDELDAIIGYLLGRDEGW
jgi:mono/diheme cytochrome c family protein